VHPSPEGPLAQTARDTGIPAKRLLWGLVIVCVVWLFSSTVAVLRLSRSEYSQEVRAITAIRATHTAQSQYFSQFQRYATNLRELGRPRVGELASAQAADLISLDLVAGAKEGYQFDLSGDGTRYTITARPTTFNVTGRRTFFSDQSLIIHEHYGPERATAQDP
jgi:hypothetical protein